MGGDRGGGGGGGEGRGLSWTCLAVDLAVSRDGYPMDGWRVAGGCWLCPPSARRVAEDLSDQIWDEGGMCRARGFRRVESLRMQCLVNGPRPNNFGPECA